VADIEVRDSYIAGPNIQLGSVAGSVTILLDRPAYRLEQLTPQAVRRVPRSQRAFDLS
jgi:hypothetical protein